MNCRKLFFIAITTVFLVGAFAGGVENKTNMTPGYARNPSRNVESKRPEAAFYNIAGTVFMDNGLYLDIGNQFVIKRYANDWDGIPSDTPGVMTVHGGETTDTTPVFLYPDVDLVWTHNWISVFGNFGVYAGGGHLDYSDGTSATAGAFAGAASEFMKAGQMAQAKGLLSAANDHSLDVTSITYGGQIGVAFKPLSFMSIAAAFRIVYGTQEMQLKANGFSALGAKSVTGNSNKIKYEADAVGFAPVIGLHFRPLDFLDFAVQFQGWAYLNYEVTDLEGNEYAASLFKIKKGKKFRTDLPPALNLGVGYKPIKPLALSLSFNYYFNKAAEQNSVLTETAYDDSWELAVGADYSILKNLGVSLGVAYSHQGSTDGVNSSFNPVLDSVTIGCGVEYNPISRLTLTLSGMFVPYIEKDYYIGGTYKSQLNKRLGVIAIGVTYRFL